MGQEKHQSGQYVSGFRDRFVNSLLLTLDFLSFSACEGSESENFVVTNQFSFQI